MRATVMYGAGDVRIETVPDARPIRSVNGRRSSWFRGARTRHEAHVRAGGVDKDVSLVETDDVNDDLDTAYRTKYGRYAASIIDSITSPEARAATLKLVPRSPAS